jgi:hypothetical protein
MATETIDRAVVEQIVANAAGATPEQIEAGATRLENMVRRGERAKGPAGFVSLATMTEAANRLRALLAPAVVGEPVAAVAPASPLRFEIRLTGGWSKSAFGDAVSRAKAMGGRYDAATKTWLLSERAVALNGGVERLSGLGLQVVTR